MNNPRPASSATAQKLIKLFEKDGVYAVENSGGPINIHRIVYIKNGTILYHSMNYTVQEFFVDYYGNEWNGLNVIYLDGFSIKPM